MSLATRVEKLEHGRCGGANVIVVHVSGGFPQEFGILEPGETGEAFVARRMAEARARAFESGRPAVCVLPKPIPEPAGLRGEPSGLGGRGKAGDAQIGRHRGEPGGLA